MFNTHRLIGSSLFVLFLFSTALAQEKRAPIDTLREPVPAAPLVTAAATAKRVRFVSPGTVVQLRLEVYNEAGQKLFDTELHGGNVLDWHLQDGAGQRLAAGSYACVLTSKSLSGRLSQRVGLVTVNDEKAAIEAAGAAQLSLAQQQAISPVGGPVEGNAAFTVLQESEAEAMTAVTHDGTDGQLTRTRGALSFRVGDFFAGTELEQMRLTEDGNLGIGTAKPQARLDVAGTIRAEKGIEFADGTVQTTGLSGRKDKDGNLVPNVAGTGTQNRLAKWTDNAGTLGDSVITEATGKLGVGTVNPNYEITLFGNDVGLQLISSATGTTANDGFRFGISSTNNAFLWNTEATDMYFGTTATERMRIKAAGNVGIGTNNPAAKLDVAGDVNTSTQYRIGGNRVLSIAGSNNTFAGLNAGAANTTGGFNSFFGSGAGLKNTTGDFNSFFGIAAGFNNTAGGSNAFFGVNAGVANTTGMGNSFFGVNTGASNTSENNNTFVGSGSNGQAGITNATAIGHQAQVTLSNSLVLGSINGTPNGATADTNVGIGTTAPLARLHVRDNNGNILLGGLGCDSSYVGISFSLSGCTNYSLLGNGTDTLINRPANGTLHFRENNSSQMTIAPGGNVGIGTAPVERLSVAGTVHSTTGGFKFPDGSVQTTAVGTTYTIARLDPQVQLPAFGLGSVLHLNLPAGTYLLSGTITMVNHANIFGQNNERGFDCSFSEQTYTSGIAGPGTLIVSLHSVLNISSGGVDLLCRSYETDGQVFARERRLTAVRIGDVAVQ